MVDFTLEAWLIIALITGACAVTMLHILARAFEEARRVHDLRVRVADLRTQYTRRLAEMNNRQSEPILEVSPIDEVPDALPLRRAA